MDAANVIDAQTSPAAWVFQSACTAAWGGIGILAAGILLIVVLASFGGRGSSQTSGSDGGATEACASGVHVRVSTTRARGGNHVQFLAG